MKFASRIFEKDASEKYYDKNGQYFPLRASSSTWRRETFETLYTNSEAEFLKMEEIVIDKNYLTIDDDLYNFPLFKNPPSVDFLTSRTRVPFLTNKMFKGRIKDVYRGFMIEAGGERNEIKRTVTSIWDNISTFGGLLISLMLINSVVNTLFFKPLQMLDQFFSFQCIICPDELMPDDYFTQYIKVQIHRISNYRFDITDRIN